MTEENELPPLSEKHQAVLDEYLICWVKWKAYSKVFPRASQESAKKLAWVLFREPNFKAHLRERLNEVHMSADEALARMADIARGDVGEFWDEDGNLILVEGKTKLIRKIKKKRTTYSNSNFDREIETEEIELYSALDALDKFLRVHGKYQDSLNINTNATAKEKKLTLTADLIAPDFFQSYRAIQSGKFTEYIEYGGRGSAKSSFVSLAFIYLLVNNPQIHGLGLRQVKDTIRDSIYAQLQWAIGELGLNDQFKCTTSPLEMVYLPTGQTIYFRGANDPGSIKSIKPPFGYIGIVYFEELDQFHGPEAVRKIEQSVIRGGDLAWIFKVFNPPITKSNWANKYLTVPKDTQYRHKSNYLTVPIEWLGEAFVKEAEHLKEVNPTAYEHEYMGNPVNDGGLVFPNVVLRQITDEEISQFDRVLNGLDWGYAVNPASFGKMHYDATRRKLYIFAEGQYLRMSNERLFNQLVSDGLITKTEYREGREKVIAYPDLIIADSAEPKSVGDGRAYGLNIRGAEKGPESVRYSIKWLQGLTAIIIDPVRAPKHAQEFTNYEYERTKDGEIIDEYPDKDNDTIDDTRYACNILWRKRGM